MSEESEAEFQGAEGKNVTINFYYKILTMIQFQLQKILKFFYDPDKRAKV